jgi:hypothetical protein
MTTPKEKPRLDGDQDRGDNKTLDNPNKSDPLSQVLSGDRSGFKTYDEALLKGLAELAASDPVEYARRKPEASKQLGVSPYDLDRLVHSEQRKPQKQESRDFKLIKACDLTAKSPKWLIHGLIEDDTFGLLFGDSESGKTFLAVDFALCVATGTPFHGRKVLTHGPVVYILGEGRNGFSRRLLAWSLHNAKDYQDAPFFISTMPAAFLHPESIEQVAAAVAEIKPVLIVVDTLARNYGPGDENSTADMNRFVTALDFIRRPYNATLLIIHHTGHGEKDRSRGAYALKCALDFEYRIKRESDGTVILESTKMKDAEKPEPLAFAPQEIKLVDDDGRPMGSLALEATEMPEKHIRLPASQRIALEALTRLLADKESVHIDEWRAECYATGISDTQAGKRKAFQRAREALSDNKLISVRDDQYWLVGQAGHCGTCP